MPHMRRTLPVAFLSVLLVTLPSAFPQHASPHSGGFSGGHVSAPSGHSFSGGFSSGSYGRSSGFARGSFSSAPRMTFTAPARAFVPGYSSPNAPAAARSRGGRNGDRYRSPYRGSANRYAYGGYPYGVNSWQLLPWDIGYPDFTGYNNGYDPGYYPGSENALQPTAAVDAPDSGDRPGYQGAPYSLPADPVSAPAPLAPEPQLTLIFKDGHQEPIRNYVLTASAVLVLDQAAAGRQQRIPLADLNLSATQQAAQQAGLDFSPPT